MEKDDVNQLKRTLEAYEKLSDLSHRELIEANRLISAHEEVEKLSREELLRLHDQVRELETEKATLESKIRSVLHEDPTNELHILNELEEIRKNSDSGFFINLFRVLLHHEFEANEAMHHWSEILKHCESLSRALGRAIGFRVAMMDYFINLNRLLKSPVILEISLYDEMVKNSLMDELTNVYNRRYFDRCLIREFNRARRHSHDLSIAVLDIDNFKQFNDVYGHAVGDEVLRTFSAQLRTAFRTEDIVCRYGGEEFVIVLPQTNSRNALMVVDRFLEDVRKLNFYAGAITASGGVSGFPEHASEAKELFRMADKAMFVAKNSGKNRVILADEVKE